MKILLHKNFEKELSKLPVYQKKHAKKAINIFKDDPHHPQLRNHALHIDQKGNRAIAAGGDLRLVFREENHYEFVVFLSVGTHNQVY